MYPSIITDSLELNVPYFKKLIAILSLESEEEYEASFDFNSPESFNDFLQMQFIHCLLNIGFIGINKDSNQPVLNARWGVLPKDTNS